MVGDRQTDLAIERGRKYLVSFLNVLTGGSLDKVKKLQSRFNIKHSLSRKILEARTYKLLSYFG